jgi:hypothetical protein
VIVYLRVVYGQIRRYTDENAIVYGLSKRRLHTISVLLRFSPYTDTEIYDRNTITGIKAKHGRKRPFTEFVTFNLGINLFPRIHSFAIEIIDNDTLEPIVRYI